MLWDHLYAPAGGGWAPPMALGGLLGGGQKAATPPPVPAPLAIPDLQDPAILEAKRRAQESALARSGRASTILAGDSDYSGTRTGAA